MKLTVLGSGSAVQFQKRGSASYLLDFGNKKLLLDAGFYLLERLEAIEVSVDSIDFIFISHKHPDHFLGLLHLLFALKNPFYKKENPIHIFGFKGLKAYINEFKNILGKWIEPPNKLIISENISEAFENFSYKLFKTEHSECSVGIELFSNKKKIDYTSDTEYFPELINITNNSHITIFECASPDKEKIKGHLSFDDILKISNKSNIETIILSHFYPDSLPQTDIPPKFIIAEDLMDVEL